MIITIASYKGGVAKTTTAVHLAGYFQTQGDTLLVDGDPSRNASKWNERGGGKFPFLVTDERQALRLSKAVEHIIIDTKARPSFDDFKALVDGCDYLIVPTTPDPLAIDGLMDTISSLNKIKDGNYRILITRAPAKPCTFERDARKSFAQAGLPVFQQSIPNRLIFQKAALHGCLVNQIKPNRQEMKDYINVAKEIEAWLQNKRTKQVLLGTSYPNTEVAL